MHPTELDALYAFLAAATVTALLTPLTMRLARTVGAMDQPRERGLANRPTPLLGGLAIFAGALLAGLIWLPDERAWHGVLIAAAVITLVGALDDRFDLPPVAKLAGQVLAALIVVHYGVLVERIRLPFLGLLPFRTPATRSPSSASCDHERRQLLRRRRRPRGRRLRDHRRDARRDRLQPRPLRPGVLAALIAGASLGFLVHNFPPASSFMGDCGANLLGLLMGCLAVEGAVKTEVVLSFVAAADPARRAVPRHDLRRAQAPEVPPPDLRLRQRALPPPHGPHRLLAPAHDRLPLRLDADARRPRALAALRPLQRPQRPLLPGLDARRRRDRPVRRRSPASTSSTCSRSSSSAASTRSGCAGCGPRPPPVEIEQDVTKDLETGEFQTISS